MNHCPDRRRESEVHELDQERVDENLLHDQPATGIHQLVVVQRGFPGAKFVRKLHTV